MLSGSGYPVSRMNRRSPRWRSSAAASSAHLLAALGRSVRRTGRRRGSVTASTERSAMNPPLTPSVRTWVVRTAAAGRARGDRDTAHRTASGGSSASLRRPIGVGQACDADSGRCHRRHPVAVASRRLAPPHPGCQCGDADAACQGPQARRRAEPSSLRSLRSFIPPRSAPSRPCTGAAPRGSATLPSACW